MVTEAWCASEPALNIIIHHALVGWLIFISFPGLLSGILKPDHDDSWSQSQQFGEILEIIILGVGILLKELLEHFDLVVAEPRPVCSLAVYGHVLLARREPVLAALGRGGLAQLTHVAVDGQIVKHLAEAVLLRGLSEW